MHRTSSSSRAATSPPTRSSDAHRQELLRLLNSWPSFYEAVGCQAPRRSSSVRASSRRSGLLPSRELAEAAPVTSSLFDRTSCATHTGRSVRSQASPDHLLSVVTSRHAPAARMRWTEGRAAPSVRRFPQEPGGPTSGAHQCRRAAPRPRGVRSAWVSAVRHRAPRRGPRTATARSPVCAPARQCQSGGCVPRRPQTAG